MRTTRGRLCDAGSESVFGGNFAARMINRSAGNERDRRRLLQAAGLSGLGVAGAGALGAVGGGGVAAAAPGRATAAAGAEAQISEHVAFLRTALGAAAGLVKPGHTFDAFACEKNFLLAAFLFEDVGVTAYKGAAPLISNKTYLQAAAGILAVEAYHAGNIRSALVESGNGLPGTGLFTHDLRQASVTLSDARDSLDGTTDLDQGVVDAKGQANVAPTDANGSGGSFPRASTVRSTPRVRSARGQDASENSVEEHHGDGGGGGLHRAGRGFRRDRDAVGVRGQRREQRMPLVRGVGGEQARGSRTGRSQQPDLVGARGIERRQIGQHHRPALGSGGHDAGLVRLVDVLPGGRVGCAEHGVDLGQVLLRGVEPGALLTGALDAEHHGDHSRGGGDQHGDAGRATGTWPQAERGLAHPGDAAQDSALHPGRWFFGDGGSQPRRGRAELGDFRATGRAGAEVLFEPRALVGAQCVQGVGAGKEVQVRSHGGPFASVRRESSGKPPVVRTP